MGSYPSAFAAPGDDVEPPRPLRGFSCSPTKLFDKLVPHVGVQSRTRRLAAKIVADLAVVVVAVLAAYLARFEQVPQGAYGAQLVTVAVMLPCLRVILWQAFGVYSQSWRLFGLTEALTLGAATGAASVALVVVRVVQPVLGSGWLAVPLGVIALEGFATLLGTSLLRVGVRLLDEYEARAASRARSTARPRRALLVGAGRAGRLVARELLTRPDMGYRVIGFLDDDTGRRGQVMEGLKVLGTTADAAEIGRRTGAEVLVLAMPSATRSELRAVVDRCANSGLPVRTVPGFHEFLGERLEVGKIRPLRIEDVLGREVVQMDASGWTRLRGAFAGKRVAVTGAGGSIGSELCRQLASLGIGKLILIENNENNLFEIDAEMRTRLGDAAVACLVDTRDRGDLERVFDLHRPQVVFHAAAYKHVPMMEDHPHAAVDNNVLGTRCTAELAHEYGVERFLLVSTDKAVNPVNVMGASKRLAEMVVQGFANRSATKFCCVRFGNVLGSRGSVFHTFRRQIEEGGPLTVTHPEVTRFFMTIPEAVRLVILAAASGRGGEVFLLDMGEPVKILDLARQMIVLAGATEQQVPIEFVGLRPGEKLHEELLYENEGATPSDVAGIYLAKLPPVDAREVDACVRRLSDAIGKGDVEALRRELFGGGARSRFTVLEHQASAGVA